jgi:ATP-binding cassette subfamily B protein
MDADIGRMPQGLYTYVGEEGIPLSSGLRQRLLIARALAANPRIILLDNTSGALSDEAQAQLMRNLTRVDATRIVITNRLHVAAAANRILVLHEGRLVESGTYASLSRSGRFLALAQAQSR